MARSDTDRDTELEALRQQTAALREACAETRREAQDLKAALSAEVADSLELRLVVRESVAEHMKNEQTAQGVSAP